MKSSRKNLFQKYKNTFFTTSAIVGSLILTSGCSSIVRKPEINGVKKVAIVSLYANETVPWTGGPGRVERWSLETKQRVAQNIYKTYTEEFKKLNWETIPMSTVAQNTYYKKEFGPQQATANDNILAKAAAIGGQLRNERFFTAPGLFPIEWPKQGEDGRHASLNLANFTLEAKKDLKSQLGELAENLKVDAVVLVYLDFCYTGATAVLGNGTAKMTAGSWIKAVSSDKVAVVDMPPIEKRCDGPRGESNRTIAMVGGNVFAELAAQDTIVTMFAEASKDTAKFNIEAIDKAIKN